jgi:hypothetical protein
MLRGGRGVVARLARAGTRSASEVATVKEGGSSTPSASAAAPKAVAAPTPVSVTPPARGSTILGRLGAFFVGTGVGSALFFLYVRQDLSESTEVLERALGTVQKDLAGTNQELRQRIAALEHQVASLKHERS